MKRPIVITVWAVFLTIASVVGIGSSVWGLLSGAAREVGLWQGFYAFYQPFSLVVGIAILIGIWGMRRWAFAGYIAMQLLSVAVLLVVRPSWSEQMPQGIWGSLIISAIFAATTLPHWSKMTWRILPGRTAPTAQVF